MSNARDWHAVALDKLDRQIAATADRWGECVHGPEVAISLRGMRSGPCPCSPDFDPERVPVEPIPGQVDIFGGEV